MKISVDVISDVICPWCFIGKRWLEKAIAAVDGQHEIKVRWHPFQLNPAMPKEGISRKDYRIRKFGSWERSLELDAKVIAVGASEGIQFEFDMIERTPNTVDAHRLIWLADQHGCQDAVVEALFLSCFTDGRDISNRQTLISVVSEAGLERHKAEMMLESEEGMDVLEKGGTLSHQHQVSGVPYFIINNGITLSGAQEPKTFVQAFRQMVAVNSPA